MMEEILWVSPYVGSNPTPCTMTIQTNCEVCGLPTLGAYRCKVCRKRSCPRCLIVEKLSCKNCAGKS